MAMLCTLNDVYSIIIQYEHKRFHLLLPCMLAIMEWGTESVQVERNPFMYGLYSPFSQAFFSTARGDIITIVFITPSFQYSIRVQVCLYLVPTWSWLR